MRTSGVLSRFLLIFLIIGAMAGCPPAQRSLTITVTGNGSTDPPAGTYTYDDGTPVTITATAGSGAAFDHWQGDLTGNANPATITMDGDKSVEAVFTGGQGAFVEVPDPLSGANPLFNAFPVPPVPAAGQSVTDANFNTTQTRVVATPRLRHEYSRFDPFNHGQTMILLQKIDSGEWQVYRTQTIPYDQSANLVTTVNLDEPRWDPVNPNLMWGEQNEFQLATVDVTTGQTTLVKDFAQDATLKPILTAHPHLYRITMKDEGESSADKRYWAFMLQDDQDYLTKYVFTWDRQIDQVLGVLPLTTTQGEMDWAGMSVNGNWILLGGDETFEAPLTGFVMANKELTQFHRLDYATAHADVGLDINGNEVVVMQNVRTDYVDMMPLDLNTQPILDPNGSYTGTNRVPLVRLFYDSGPLGLSSGVHISCNCPGYCVISTVIDQGAPEQNWLDRKIILVKLDPAHPRAFYLAKVYGTKGTTSTGDPAYWEETHGAITNDGTKVIWSTNWNQQVGQENVWDVVLNMPANWQAAVR